MILYIKNIKLRENIKEGGIKFEAKKFFSYSFNIHFSIF